MFRVGPENSSLRIHQVIYILIESNHLSELLTGSAVLYVLYDGKEKNILLLMVHTFSMNKFLAVYYCYKRYYYKHLIAGLE